MSCKIKAQKSRGGGCIEVSLDGHYVGHVERLDPAEYVNLGDPIVICVDDVETSLSDLRDMIEALTKLAEIAEGMMA